MNNISIIGRLTRNPEIKISKNNKELLYCNFDVAVRREFVDEVDFINCVAFNKTAEFIANYFRKGDHIGITGALNMNIYEKDGIKRKVATVNIRQVCFCENSVNKINEDDLKFNEVNIEQIDKAIAENDENGEFAEDDYTVDVPNFINDNLPF